MPRFSRHTQTRFHDIVNTCHDRETPILIELEEVFTITSESRCRLSSTSDLLIWWNSR